MTARGDGQHTRLADASLYSAPEAVRASLSPDDEAHFGPRFTTALDACRPKKRNLVVIVRKTTPFDGAADRWSRRWRATRWFCGMSRQRGLRVEHRHVGRSPSVGSALRLAGMPVGLSLATGFKDVVHLRAVRDGGQPSTGLPTVAHAELASVSEGWCGREDLNLHDLAATSS
jgi:hypothetical protein